MKIGYTHSGNFHADEVMSTALLKVLFPQIEIHRLPDKSYLPDPMPEDAIAYDIGGGEFDHHGTENITWPDGTPASSAGLIWWKYGDRILDKLMSPHDTEESRNLARKEIEELIKSIDALDNGVFDENAPNVFTWSSFIRNLNPEWTEDTREEDAFKTATSWSSYLLRNIAFGPSPVDWASVRKHFEKLMEKENIRPFRVPCRDRGAVLGVCGNFWSKYGAGILAKYFGITSQGDRQKAMKMVDTRLFLSLDTWYESTNQYSMYRTLGFFLNDDLHDLLATAVIRTCTKVVSILKAKPYVEEAIKASEHGVLVLKQYVPWKGTLMRSDHPKARTIRAVVFPSKKEGYNVQAVPGRTLFPEEWPALPESELKARFGVRFCTSGRFLIATDTEAQAIAASSYCV